MISRRHFFILAFIITLALFSCRKDPLLPPAIDKTYFPLEVGKYIIYDVDSIRYFVNLAGDTASAHYQLMEMIDSAYLNSNGDTAYRIARSRRVDEFSPWNVTDIWSADLTDHTAEKVEENLRFVKLDFPILLDKKWSGNIFVQAENELEFLRGWRYKYTDVYTPLTINALHFDSTLTVLQHDSTNAILTIQFTEQYAKYVGLIYKHELYLHKDSLNAEPKGYELTLTVKEYN